MLRTDQRGVCVGECEAHLTRPQVPSRWYQKGKLDNDQVSSKYSSNETFQDNIFSHNVSIF